MSDSSIDVKYVANLARLDLNEEEIQDFTSQGSDVALKNAPDQSNQQFKVTRVVE